MRRCSTFERRSTRVCASLVNERLPLNDDFVGLPRIKRLHNVAAVIVVVVVAVVVHFCQFPWLINLMKFSFLNQQKFMFPMRQNSDRTNISKVIDSDNKKKRKYF